MENPRDSRDFFEISYLWQCMYPKITNQDD